MFTGLIEELGVVENLNLGRKPNMTISVRKILENVQLGDSVAVNGVCLTVDKINKNLLTFNFLEETLKDTGFRKLKKNQKVNLERALLANSRLGGHFVSGHVDVVGKILSVKKSGEFINVEIQYAKAFAKYVVVKGSVAVDGISLTIQKVNKDSFVVGLIPHTFAQTNLQEKKNNDLVNLEFDLLAKYVEAMLGKSEKNKKISKFVLY